MKSNDDRIGPLQFKRHLYLFVYLGVMWLIANPVKNMKIDEILATADQERERPLRIETGCRGRAGNERLQIGERAHIRRNWCRAPHRNFRPDQERRPRLETLGHLHSAV